MIRERKREVIERERERRERGKIKDCVSQSVLSQTELVELLCN